MILVLLGTQNNDFTRLLREVQNNIDNGIIKEDVVVQAGSTKFESKDMKIFSLVPTDELLKLQEQARVIITHGGVGSIISSIKLGKKVIAIPRLAKYGEHVNDHQIQIVESFAKNGLIKGIFDIEKLGETLEKIESFSPTVFKSNTGNMIKIIENFIDNN